MKRNVETKNSDNNNPKNEQGTRAEEPYSTQLNGINNRAPPWPRTQLKNENMFILPRRLNLNDQIIISGEIQSDPKMLTVALVTGYDSPDYENIACQLDLNYPPNNEDKIAIKIVENGYSQVVNDSNPTSGFFPGRGSYFKISFKMAEEGMYIDAGDSYLEQIELKHNANDIRFLTVSGDVSKVSELVFQFG